MVDAKFPPNVRTFAMWRRMGVSALILAAFLTLSGPSMPADSARKPVTFAKDVAPILQAKCQECHR